MAPPCTVAMSMRRAKARARRAASAPVPDPDPVPNPALAAQAVCPPCLTDSTSPSSEDSNEAKPADEPDELRDVWGKRHAKKMIEGGRRGWKCPWCGNQYFPEHSTHALWHWNRGEFTCISCPPLPKTCGGAHYFSSATIQFREREFENSRLSSPNGQWICTERCKTS